MVHDGRIRRGDAGPPVRSGCGRAVSGVGPLVQSRRARFAPTRRSYCLPSRIRTPRRHRCGGGERVRKLPSTGVEDSKIGELLARPKKTVKCFAPRSIRGCPRMTSRLARDAGARHQARLDDRGPEQRHRFRRIRTRATGEAVGSCAPARRDFLNAFCRTLAQNFAPLE